MKKHRNTVIVYGSQITDIQIIPDSLVISEGQPSDSSPSIGQEDDNWSIMLECGRHGTPEVAEAFQQKVGSGHMYAQHNAKEEMSPNKLNFFFGVMISFGNTQVPVYLGQGHYDDTNNWWIGSENLAYNGGFSLNVDGQDVPVIALNSAFNSASHYDPDYFYDKPYNQVQMKGSHNSYERHESLIDQIPWISNGDSGCMALELDIHYDDGEWRVYHEKNHHKHPTLAVYLDHLQAYIDNHRENPVITLDLDLKENEELPHIIAVESYITNHLKRESIYTPGDWLIDNRTTNERDISWPAMSELTGKVILCLTGSHKKRDYIKTDPQKRLCFADMGMPSNGDSGLSSPEDIVKNLFINIDIRHFRDWAGIKALMTDSKIPYVFRGYKVESNDPELWQKACEAGLNIIATDAVSGHDWAYVSKQGPFCIL